MYADAHLFEDSNVIEIALVGASLFEQYEERERESSNDPDYENLYPDLS